MSTAEKLSFRQRPESEIHLAKAARELRHAMAKNEPLAIEIMEIHQRVVKLLHRMRSC